MPEPPGLFSNDNTRPIDRAQLITGGVLGGTLTLAALILGAPWWLAPIIAAPAAAVAAAALAMALRHKKRRRVR